MSIGGLPRAEKTPTTAPHHEGLRVHELRLLQCTTCERWYWPFSGCTAHNNEPYFTNMEWRKASGKGKIFCFNIHIQEFVPTFSTPYIYALVETAEGPLLPALVLPVEGRDVWSVNIGDDVVAEYLDVDSEQTVLRFRVR